MKKKKDPENDRINGIYCMGKENIDILVEEMDFERIFRWKNELILSLVHKNFERMNLIWLPSSVFAKLQSNLEANREQ